MKKIVDILVAKLTQFLNNEHSNFIDDVLQLCLKFNPKTQKIDKEVAVLQAAHAKEYAALDPERSSAYTEQIRVSDELRTSIGKGLENLIKVNLKNPDKACAEAAGRLKIMFDSHDDMYHKSYNIKTSIISDIIYDINLKYTADIAKISATDWVTKLDAENKNFIALMEKRFDESSNRSSDTMPTVRPEVDDAYLTLTTRLTALMIIEEPEKFYPFVNELNSYIKYYNERVKQRQTNNKSKQQDIGTAQMSSIGDQTYTGAEIIPAFDLLYTDPKTLVVVALEKGKDYTVECINNTAIGTATLTAHGKGAYVGKLVTRFNIVAS